MSIVWKRGHTASNIFGGIRTATHARELISQIDYRLTLIGAALPLLVFLATPVIILLWFARWVQHMRLFFNLPREAVEIQVRDRQKIAALNARNREYWAAQQATEDAAEARAAWDALREQLAHSATHEAPPP